VPGEVDGPVAFHSVAEQGMVGEEHGGGTGGRPLLGQPEIVAGEEPGKGSRVADEGVLGDVVDVILEEGVVEAAAVDARQAAASSSESRRFFI